MVSSVTFPKEVCSVESAKRKLNLEEPRINQMETEVTRAPIWKSKKSRRLDFGETDPSLLLYCPGESMFLLVRYSYFYDSCKWLILKFR